MGFEPLPYYGWPTFPSVLWCCWLGLLTCKTVSRITYTALVETLNPAQSNLIHYKINICLSHLCYGWNFTLLWWQYTMAWGQWRSQDLVSGGAQPSLFYFFPFHPFPTFSPFPNIPYPQFPTPFSFTLPSSPALDPSPKWNAVLGECCELPQRIWAEPGSQTFWWMLC